MPNRPAFIVVFALVANNEVYLKADVVNQPSFVASGDIEAGRRARAKSKPRLRK